MFLETHSLTKVEPCFGERYTTKRGKNFTRFSIKGILTNPVYMIADEAAYRYFTENQVDLFAEKSDFDGKHGVLAYNRTLQRNGKTTISSPVRNGSYPWGNTGGLSPQRFGWKYRPCWSTTDPRLPQAAQQRGAAVRPTGLRCCGDYMYPKLSNRPRGERRAAHTYVCPKKERSHRCLCDGKTRTEICSTKLISEIEALAEDKAALPTAWHKAKGL